MDCPETIESTLNPGNERKFCRKRPRLEVRSSSWIMNNNPFLSLLLFLIIAAIATSIRGRIDVNTLLMNLFNVNNHKFPNVLYYNESKIPRPFNQHQNRLSNKTSVFSRDCPNKRCTANTIASIGKKGPIKYQYKDEDRWNEDVENSFICDIFGKKSLVAGGGPTISCRRTALEEEVKMRHSKNLSPFSNIRQVRAFNTFMFLGISSEG